MPIVKLGPAGQYGVNKDLSEPELPPNAWSDVNNIRFLDGYAYQCYGYGSIYNPPTVVPYHVRLILSGSTRYLLYAGTAKVYGVNGTTHTSLARAAGDYTGAANTWTSCALSGIPIINDGSGLNYPGTWDLDITHKFVDMTTWQANYYCKAIRSFRASLVALNITKTTTNYPFMVKWNHPSDPGTTNGSWDQTDTTKDAGEYDLADGGDIIVDGLALRESFMIYKTNSCWRMDYIGGPFVYRFTKVGGTSGLLARNCVVEMDGWHFCVGGSDVYIHDGQSISSILDKQSRRFFFSNLDSDNYAKTFAFKNEYLNECCIAYCSSGNSTPNKLLVFNYVDKTVSFRDAPSILHACSGLLESGTTSSWDSDSAPWDSDITVWNQTDFTPDSSRVVWAGINTKLYLMDASASNDGTIPSAYMERRGLTFGAAENRKLVRGVRPLIQGTAGETVIVSVGYSDDPYAIPTYTDMTHTIGSTLSNDCLVSGRYISIKIATGTSYQWRVDEVALDVVNSGRW